MNARYLLMHVQWNMINVLKKTVELHPIVHFLSIYFISSFFTDFFWDFIGLIIKFCYYIYWINLIPFFIYFFLFFVVLKRSSWSCTNINFNIFLLIELILKIIFILHIKYCKYLDIDLLINARYLYVHPPSKI